MSTPGSNGHDLNHLGWKFFFALLMILQIVGIGVMWRTYDSIQTTTAKANMTEYKVDQVIIPAIQSHELQIRTLEANFRDEAPRPVVQARGRAVPAPTTPP